MDAKLFDEAQDRAVRQDDVVAGLERLASLGEADVGAELKQEVHAARASIESAASRELARLAEIERRQRAAEEEAVLQAVAADPDAQARLEALRLRRRQLVGAPRASQRPRAHDPGEIAAVEREIQELKQPVRERVHEQLEQWPELASVEERLHAAREDALRAITERGMLEVIRRWLNRRLQKVRSARYSRDLSAASADGLGQLEDPDREIATTAEARLSRLLNQMPSGSVGISGLRGAGKTTLIRGFCRGDRVIRGRLPSVHVMVSAPVKFVPLEFVLHMFECVCSSVLPKGARIHPLEGEHAQRRRILRIARALSALAAAAGGALLLAGAALVVRGVEASELSSQRERLLVGGALIAAGIVVMSSRTSGARSALAVGIGLLAYGGSAVVAATSGDAFGAADWLLLLAGLLALLALASAMGAAMLARAGTPTFRAVAGVTMATAGSAVAVSAALTTDVTSEIVTGGLMLLGSGVAYAALPGLIERATGDEPSWYEEYQAEHELIELAERERAWVEEFASTATREDRKRLALIRARRADVLAELEKLRGGRSEPDRLRAELRATGAWQLAQTVAGASVCIAGLGAGLIALGWSNRSLDDSLIAGIALFTAGACVAAPALSVWVAAGLIAADPDDIAAPDEQPSETGLEQMYTVQRAAREQLRKIRFLQTHSSSWSGKVSVPGALRLPFSAEAGVGGGLSASEQPLTFPAVVDQLKTFLTEAVSGDERVLIGIDELDKIGSEDDAESFLNEIKAVFGLPNCYFLISVSEDAVASFERRGMPFRDVFDSSFDDILRVDHFALRDSVEILDGRTLLVSIPFMALCHAISGGLPRDLIRVARQLFALRDAGRGSTLPDLCRTVVGDELLAKRDGTVTAVRRLGQDVDTSPALAWLGSRKRTVLTAAPGGDPPPAVPAPWDWPESRAAALKLERLLREYSVFRCLGITLIEFFSASRTDADFERAEYAKDARSIDQLALARQAFAVEPELAWERLSAFRRAWEMDPRDGPSRLAGHLYSPNGAATDELEKTRERLRFNVGPFSAVVTGPD